MAAAAAERADVRRVGGERGDERGIVDLDVVAQGDDGGGGAGFQRGDRLVGPAVVQRYARKALFGEEARARVDHGRRDAERRRQRGKALRDLHRADDQQAARGIVAVDEHFAGFLRPEIAVAGGEVGGDGQRLAAVARVGDAIEEFGVEAGGGDGLHHHRDLAAAGQADLPGRGIGDAVALQLEGRAGNDVGGGLQDIALDAAARHRSFEPAVAMDEHMAALGTRRAAPGGNHGGEGEGVAFPFARGGEDAVVFGHDVAVPA